MSDGPIEFTPIRTERLLIRPFRPDDAAGLAQLRDDPEVATYQNWALPFTLAQTEEMVSAVTAMSGPENEEWWSAVVCDPDSGEAFGDVAARLSFEGRSAQIGSGSRPGSRPTRPRWSSWRPWSGRSPTPSSPR